jgi:hypothetical protein
MDYFAPWCPCGKKSNNHEDTKPQRKTGLGLLGVLVGKKQHYRTANILAFPDENTSTSGPFSVDLQEG